MTGQALTIARNTFVEGIRQPIFFVMIVIAGILQVLNTWGANFSMGMSSTAEVSGDNKLLLDIGLATIFVCALLLAAFIATSAVSREIENRTVLTVVSKPVSRAALVLGKFAGLALAMTLALAVMVVMLLMGIRHGVMSTSSDTLDGPVLVFSISAWIIAVGAALWCNFFYGWSFSQTASLLLLPLMLLAYVLVLLVSKKWAFQEIGHDFKPQVLTACVSTILASLVLTAFATAVSTRLGQVMTIIACVGFFLVGLLSNHLLGRHAISNPLAGVVKSVNVIRYERTDRPMAAPGDSIEVTLDSLPDLPMNPGTSVYWGENPNGFRLLLSSNPPFAGDSSSEAQWRDPAKPGNIVVAEASGPTLTLRRVGGRLNIQRLPRPGDYVFTAPTSFNTPVLAAWAVVPNMQLYWLIDAVAQNRPVPVSHFGLLTAYAVLQIGACLALGVALFQTRDVG